MRDMHARAFQDYMGRNGTMVLFMPERHLQPVPCDIWHWMCMRRTDNQRTLSRSAPSYGM
eukprot:5530831-Karenia_brevis.AAC.1